MCHLTLSKPNWLPSSNQPSQKFKGPKSRNQKAGERRAVNLWQSGKMAVSHASKNTEHLQHAAEWADTLGEATHPVSILHTLSTGGHVEWKTKINTDEILLPPFHGCYGNQRSLEASVETIAPRTTYYGACSSFQTRFQIIPIITPDISPIHKYLDADYTYVWLILIHCFHKKIDALRTAAQRRQQTIAAFHTLSRWDRGTQRLIHCARFISKRQRKTSR